MRPINGTATSRILSTAFAILFISFLFIPWDTLFAGDTTGKIRGIITDGLGNPLEGVDVTIRDTTSESRVFTMKTKKNGRFSRLGLDIAVHTVEAEMEGFRPSSKQVRTRIGIWIEANMTMFKEGSVGSGASGPMTDEEKAIESFNSALLLIEEGKDEEALAALDKAIELDDMIYEPLQTKGQVFFEQGEHDLALEQFQAAMEMGSSDPSNYFFLSEIWKAKGDAVKAEEYSQRYLTEADDVNVDVLFNLAAKAINDGDDAGAKEYLEQILAAQPEYADAHRELGYVLIREGDFPGTKEHFQKYLELKPDADDAAEITSMMEIL